MNDFFKGYNYYLDELKKVDPKLTVGEAIEEVKKSVQKTLFAKPTVVMTKFDKKTDSIVVDKEKTQELHLQKVLSGTVKPNVYPYLLDEDSKEGQRLIDLISQKRTADQKIPEVIEFFQQCKVKLDKKFLESHFESLFINIKQLTFIIENTSEEVLTEFCKCSFGTLEISLPLALEFLARNKKLISY